MNISKNAEQKPVLIKVEGMACSSCVAHVEKAIRATPGVASVAVDLAGNKAEVVFSGTPDVAAVVAAIVDAGYEAAAE